MARYSFIDDVYDSWDHNYQPQPESDSEPDSKDLLYQNYQKEFNRLKQIENQLTKEKQNFNLFRKKQMYMEQMMREKKNYNKELAREKENIRKKMNTCNGYMKHLRSCPKCYRKIHSGLKHNNSFLDNDTKSIIFLIAIGFALIIVLDLFIRSNK